MMNIDTYNAMHVSYRNPYHPLQLIDLRQLLIVAHDHAMQVIRNLVLTNDTTIQVLVFQPNQPIRRILDEMVQVDRAQQVYNDSHLY